MIKKCSDCGGELEEGAMMDFTYGAVGIQRHAKTQMPQDGQKFQFGMHEASFEDIRRVVAFRCVKCNRIYHYAQDFVLMKSLWAGQKNAYWFIGGLMVFFTIITLLAVFLFVR